MSIFQTIYNNTKIRCILAVCICLWIAVMIQVVVTMAFEKETDITQAFSLDDNVNISKCSIEGTACLNVDRQSFDNTAVLFLEKFAKEMAGEAAEESYVYSEEILPCYKFTCNTDEVEINSTVSWSDRMKQAYFHCNMSIKGNMESMKKMYKKLKSEFNNDKTEGYISDEIIYSAIEAGKKGVINENERIQYVDLMFDRLGAKQISDGGCGYYTAYGYTPAIYDDIKSGNNRINVQASFTYDEQKDVTRICLGSPVLNMDY